ncbi:cytochrome C biogenesis protein ResB [Acidithiobacillus marinus]|uniref:Cytochrome C biogenesis protein ResB n=1 Tax=Acidithiobacillus marinus TaxID=187490 RepID=A0A2I1DNZ4_9PROT|nr:cytochrome c biogenesis protein ResB [Acidithiobacillus marinus]PKY11598.1 cytochrome C biogenesis protein ResB [Acidithiobacillus marinus]
MLEAHAPVYTEPLSIRIVVRVLGSMRLAVHLLLFVAIASIIGTILPQQEVYTDYLHQFGPFWFTVLGHLDLYDVYRCGWYMGIVAFLITSTTVCVLRNAPPMVREMRHVPSSPSAHFLKKRPEHFTSISAKAHGEILQSAVAALRDFGYQARSVQDTAGKTQLFAQKGRFYRIGYLLTHVGIILFCVGAIYNANLPLKWAEWTGTVHPEKNFDLPLSKIPQSSWLSSSSSAFRGIITIPVGQTVNAMFELVGDGFLVQHLPFMLRLDAFKVTHYSNGLAKDFVSKVSIYHHNGKLFKTGIVRVNHPLSVDGVQIYQSSYSDSASKLQLHNYLLSDPGLPPAHIVTGVGEQLKTFGAKYAISISDFKTQNVIPRKAVGLSSGPNQGMINMGPTISYQVTNHRNGMQVLIKSYLKPFSRNGEEYRLIGFREKGSTAYHYLTIPQGPEHGIRLFMAYLGDLEQAASNGDDATKAIFIRNLDKAQAQTKIYLAPQYKDLFLQSSLKVMQELRSYPLPFLTIFHHYDLHWSAGLEITRYPGMKVIYTACFALVFGIFILFYVPRRRIWIQIDDSKEKKKIQLFADTSRNEEDFHRDMEELNEQLQERL